MPDVNDRLYEALREPIVPIAPPAALETRVLAAVADEDGETAPVPVRRERAPRRMRLAVAFAGVAALVVAIGIVADRRGDGVEGTLELATTLVAGSGAAEAAVEVRKTGIGRVIELRSESLPILPTGEYYELWFVGPGDSPARPNRISAGTFHPDEDGRSRVVFAAAADPALYPVLSVTAEPGDGDPAASTVEVLRSRAP